MGEMKKVQCLNNHFFDRNKFEVCPLCGTPEKEEKISTVIDLRTEGKDELKKDKKEKGGFFRFVRQNRNIDEINKSENPTTGLRGNLSLVIDDTIPMEIESNQKEEIREVISEKIQENVPSLVSQVNENATTIDEKTRGRFTKESEEPVVGWLICIQGESQGKSFELHDGKNSIGRMRTNKVCLVDENSVSREEHAFVMFDARNTVFYIMQGNSDKITYLNNSPVFTAQPLQELDKIQLGECELLFVPLCSERFKWEDYIK